MNIKKTLGGVRFIYNCQLNDRPKCFIIHVSHSFNYIENS